MAIREEKKVRHSTTRAASSEAEQAIRHFECATGLAVTVHDLTHSLWGCLPVTRFQHSHPVCRSVKLGEFRKRCLIFEIDEFRASAARWKTGRLHMCHAGLVELALPVFDHERLILVLFAGPARTREPTLLDVVARPSPENSDEKRSSLPDVQESTIDSLKESFHQLGSRLRCLIVDMSLDLDVTELTRSTRIKKFVDDRYHKPLRLRDLAEFLGVSGERARHIVVEECGAPFRTIVRNTRLRASRALLLNSMLPVYEIALRCGFSDQSAFTRAFRAEYGTSPREWRRTTQS